MFICMNDEIRLVSFCPVCESRCEMMETKLLGEDGKTKHMHVYCKKCRHSVLAAFIVHKAGANSIGLLTDLSYEDAVKFRTNHLVTVNDVIDLHSALENGFLEQSLDKVHSNSA